MNVLNIKPLSVNRAYRGRRFISAEYKQYKENVFMILPKNIVIPNGQIEIYFKFGVPRLSCDVDNPVKPFLDILQVAYGFNDNRVQKIVCEKEKVDKGKEYIMFEINNYTQC